MSHAIETFAHTGKKAWHGLGAQAPDNCTAAELATLAGLDWTVSKSQIYYRDNTADRKVQAAPDTFALTRDTDGKFLDVVSGKWNPVQNAQMVALFDKYAQIGNIQPDTAASLKGGNLVYMQGIMQGGFTVGKSDHGDDFVPRFLFTLPHQYAKAVDNRIVGERVVCANTHKIAMSEKSDMMLRFTHVGPNQFDEAKVIKELNAYRAAFMAYGEKMNALAAKPITSSEFVDYVKAVYGLSNATDKQSMRNTELQVIRLKSILETQPGADLGAGTAYAAYNAVTYDVDHAGARFKDAETRFISGQYGLGSARKAKALSLALAM